MKRTLNADYKPTIAFVDDEVEITEVYTSILSEYYKVISYSQPTDLLKFLELHEECPFDVLITDLKMPKISGLQLIERIHQMGFECPSILLSGYIDNKNLLMSAGHGKIQLIEKPAEIKQILSVLQDILNKKST